MEAGAVVEALESFMDVVLAQDVVALCSEAEDLVPRLDGHLVRSRVSRGIRLWR